MSRYVKSLVISFVSIYFILFLNAVHADSNDIVIVGGAGANCIEDPGCINRLHPDIPMAARADAGA